MTPKQLKAYLALLMCSDPWPVTDDPENQSECVGFANDMARACGFTDWIDAYHKL